MTVGPFGDPADGQALCHTCGNGSLVKFQEFEPKGHFVGDGGCKQLIAHILEDDARTPRSSPGGEFRNVVAVMAYLSAFWAEQTVEMAEQGAFAGAVFAEKCYALACPDCQRYPVQHGDPVGIMKRDLLDGE